MNKLLRFLVLGSALTLVSAGTPAPGGEGPWVTTDRTVDCSSTDTILKGILKPGMSDEEKSLAVYYFFRQRVYHYKNIPESRTPLKTLNAIGNTLCGSQATCMKGLLTAAGIKARVVSHPGHTFYEAYYDGKWHGFDTMENFFVYTRGEKKNVASFEELNQDPTLIRDAVKEGRAAPHLVFCGDNPMDFKDPIQVLDYEPTKSDWSVRDYRLRKGEELVRSWWPHGRFLPGITEGEDKASGPHHTCGGRDRDAEPFLFKFWEPYAVQKLGRPSVSYRHYFNGFMQFSPDLTQGDYREGIVSEKGVKASSDGLSGEGEIVWPVQCPFYITAGEAWFDATCPGSEDSVEVAISVNGGKAWTSALVARDPGRKESKADFSPAVVRAGIGRHEYQIKFTLKGKATLHRFFLRSTFTHNAMAAPHLMPGKNKITLTSGDPGTFKAGPIAIVYRYKDAPDWKGPVKTLEKVATTSPFTFEAELPETEKLPQMMDLTLRCGVLNWRPESAPFPALR